MCKWLCVCALCMCSGKREVESVFLHYCSVLLCLCGGEREREKERRGSSLLCSVKL